MPPIDAAPRGHPRGNSYLCRLLLLSTRTSTVDVGAAAHGDAGDEEPVVVDDLELALVVVAVLDVGGVDDEARPAELGRVRRALVEPDGAAEVRDGGAVAPEGREDDARRPRGGTYGPRR